MTAMTTVSMRGTTKRWCPTCDVAWTAWSDSVCWLCGAVCYTGPPGFMNSQQSMVGSAWLGWTEDQLEDLTTQPAP